MGTVDELLAMDAPSEGTIDELGMRLRDLYAVVEQARDLIAVIESDLIARMEGDLAVVPHVGVFERSLARTSRWRDKTASADFRRDVFAAIVDEVAVDKVTGDRDQLRANVARLVMQQVDDALPAFSSLKASGRKRLRIDVDQYREFDESYKLTYHGEGPDER